MKITIITFAALIFLGAIMYYFHSDKSPDDYEKLASTITTTTAEKLYNDKGLILVGSGGKMMDDIKSLMMGFEYHKIVNVDVARKLLLDSVGIYLLEINENEKIRPYLHNYPFTPENIEIVIYFRKPHDSTVTPGAITVASADDGKIKYYSNSPEKHTLKIIWQETYEDVTQAK